MCVRELLNKFQHTHTHESRQNRMTRKRNKLICKSNWTICSFGFNFGSFISEFRWSHIENGAHTQTDTHIQTHTHSYTETHAFFCVDQSTRRTFGLALRAQYGKYLEYIYTIYIAHRQIYNKNRVNFYLHILRIRPIRHTHVATTPQRFINEPQLFIPAESNGHFNEFPSSLGVGERQHIDIYLHFIGPNDYCCQIVMISPTIRSPKGCPT